MKKVWNKWITMIAAAFFVSVLNVTVSMAHDGGGVTLQVFYDELQPHGTWIAYENYGYVWRPRVDRDFVPYVTNGYWINTEYGNTWVSDYGWGWAPFHYGRWFYDDFYGWMWVPDTVWGPAWVAWRGGGGYYGWAPLMPGITVSVSYNYYDIPDRYWSFVPCRYITYRTIHRHCVPRPQVVTIIHQTTVVTHHYTDSRRRTYFTGPSRREIERVNNTRVPVYAVNDRGRPGRTEIERDRVSFYKPEIDNDRESRAQAIPSRVERRDRRSTTDVRNGLDNNAANRRPADEGRRETRDRQWQRPETNRDDNRRIEGGSRDAENRRRQEQEREPNQGQERLRQPQDQRGNENLRDALDKQNRERDDARRQEARERTLRDDANRRMQEERVRSQQRQQDQQRQQERIQERQQEQQRMQQQRMQEQQRQQERVRDQQQQQRMQDQQRRQEQQQMRQQRMTQERQSPRRMESPREHRGNTSRRRD